MNINKVLIVNLSLILLFYLLKTSVVNIPLEINKTINSTKLLNYTIYLCYSSSCPHCQHLKKYLNSLNCNKIKYIAYNVQNETQYNECKKIINKFNGSFYGVPTIIVKYNNNYYEIVGFVKATSIEYCGKDICFYDNNILGTIDVINYTFCGNFDLVIKNIK